jgi:transposase InsO family protein
VLSQPPQPHQQWDVDVSYINIAGTFYYPCSVLDGFSRFDESRHRNHSASRQGEVLGGDTADNGPQFIARDFNEFIRISGMTHVRTSRASSDAGERSTMQNDTEDFISEHPRYPDPGGFAKTSWIGTVSPKLRCDMRV